MQVPGLRDFGCPQSCLISAGAGRQAAPREGRALAMQQEARVVCTFLGPQTEGRAEVPLYRPATSGMDIKHELS